MDTEEKESEKNEGPIDDALKNIPKISKVIFHQRTGAITLQIAKDDEEGEMKKEQ